MVTEIIKIPLIKDIDIKDHGIIKHAKIKFSPNLNIITGKSGSGKTAVIKFLLDRYSEADMSRGDLDELRIDNEIGKSALLIDGLLGCFDYDRLGRVLKKLEGCGRQVIVTMHENGLENATKKIKANIIKTENFELKNQDNN